MSNVYNIVLFAGIFSRSHEGEFVQKAIFTMASYMDVSPFRLQGIQIKKDIADVFMDVILLDPPPPAGKNDE